LADFLALVTLPGLQGPNHERKAHHQHGHAEQHHEPEHERGSQEHGGDDEVGGDRAREARRDVEGASGPHRVVRDRRDDLTGRQFRPHRGTAPRRMVRDDLEHPEGRLQPVADGRTVTQHPGYGLDRSEPE